MAKEWYLITRPLYLSGFESYDFAAYGQEGFYEMLDSFIGEDMLLYDRMIRLEPKKIRAIMQHTTSDSKGLIYDRQILCPIGNIHSGYYIEARDAFWLAITPPDNNMIYEKSYLVKCKYKIRIRSPLNGEIVEYPVYMKNATQYGNGESVYDRYASIKTPTDQYLVYIPVNQETVMIDDNFRFIMDRNKNNPSVFRITRVDAVSYSEGSESEYGVLEWHVQETTFNEATDSKDLMIADYYQLHNGENNPTASGEILLHNSDNDPFLAIGSKKEVTVAYLDGGAEIPLSDYHAELISDNNTVWIEKQEGEILVLAAKYDRDSVGKRVQLHIESDSLEKEATVEFQLINW